MIKKIPALILIFGLVTCFAGQASAQCELLGDANFDGVVDDLDIPAFIQCIIDSDVNPECDINQDGLDTFADYFFLIDILTYDRGDLNRDGEISFADIPPYIEAIEAFDATGEYDPLGDINGDCIVGGPDIPLFITILIEQSN